MSVEQAFNFVAISDAHWTSGLPTAEQLGTLATQGRTAVINLLPDETEYAVPSEQDIVERQGLEYIYIPVDYSSPNNHDLIAFVTAMERLKGESIYIHCAANYRVSAFYAMYAHHRLGWSREQAEQHIASLFDLAQYPVWQAYVGEVLDQGLPA